MVAGTGQSKPNGGAQWTLSGILDNPDAFEADMTNGDEKIGEEEAIEEDNGAEEGYCIECEDQPANVYCETCTDDFCEVCFDAQHRKGTRKLHKSRPIEPTQPPSAATDTTTLAQPDADGEPKETDADEPTEDDSSDEPIAESSTARTTSSLAKRAKTIPLRLTLQERKLLRLLESALHVSEYTDRVDILSYNSSRTKRAAAQIRELCSILSGLCLAADYKAGQELFEGRDFAANEAWFARVFEIGRRHKIMNPDKMRESYGKLIYLLMDARSPDVSDLLGFSPVAPLVTVYSTLEAHDALAVLEDPRLETATREIISPPGASGRVRAEVQRSIKEKERAVEALVDEYAAGELTGRALRSAKRAAQKNEEADGLEEASSKQNGNQPISADLLRQCIYSISDNSAFLRVNRDPCEIMIGYLKKYFHPTKCTPTKNLEEAGKVEQPSLAIKNGRNGARLSHDHSKQYTYVLQSLTLWREILGDMFHLWTLAETDLLSTTSLYRLRDTGQGLNRVQHAPKTSREMHAILSRAQRDLGSWVGSSVIHMGDHNVPNALLFIDKYSQIYRILLPITNVLSHISNDARVRSYAIREFGGVEEATRMVLVDFFRSAFDGSGADSYFDAGSCIDGRLTSAWNWCSLLEKKSYFPLFLLSGFIGFDDQASRTSTLTGDRREDVNPTSAAFNTTHDHDQADYNPQPPVPVELQKDSCNVPTTMPRIRQLSEQCKDYINRSLVSSLELENRLRTASSNDPFRPLDMKFHEEWRHPDCPVNRWYTQQTSSTTQITSIQHWRNKKTPYRHEYLLIGLADGAICRLERLGQGSRAAAISRAGCIAHDIVQRFPPQTYRNTLLASDPSDLIVEFDAGGFDLLDILAICYSVQQCKRSSTYTVQRFDSHFLCATVLIILARRVAKWESRITEDDWHSMVNNMVDRLQNTTADAHEFFGLTISAVINTDQPRPRKFVLDSIKERLDASGHRGLNSEIAGILLPKDLKLAVQDSLSRCMDDAVLHALNASDPCAIRLKETLEAEAYHDPSEDYRLSEFRRSIVTEQANTLLDSLRTCASSITTSYTMDANENAIPWTVHVCSSLHTSSSFFKTLRHFGEFREELISPCGFIVKGRSTWRTLPHVMKISHIHNIKNFMRDIPSYAEMTYLDDKIRNDIIDSVVSKTYAMIQQHVAADDYTHRVLIVANDWLNKKIWTRCLAVRASKEIEDDLNRVFMLARLTTILTAQPGQTEVRRPISVFKFIDGILRRIQTHAVEIETLGLATAILIQSDIEETMSELWRYLPRGFGYGLTTSVSIADTEVPPYEPIARTPENAV
ncbi:unnamed protein product [Rhizoctonia solani]|uniref:B box-type domain-containing protein n=1 Tax=Rhizoctonia solani TaxID=456999 RepID=A0A8H3A375_9AGAM|nr:unnamed protein product [Rhizoctonia solani]